MYEADLITLPSADRFTVGNIWREWRGLRIPMAVVDGEEAGRGNSSESSSGACSLKADIRAQQHLKSVQGDLEGTLVKIITAPEPYPPPGRALRNLVGRCLVALYTRGETRTLFDTLQAFMKIVGDFKAPDKDTNKTYVLDFDAPRIVLMTHSAAFSCIGDIMAAFGSQVRSLKHYRDFY